MVFGQVPYRSTTAHQMYEEIRSKKLFQTENFTYNNYTASKDVTLFLKEVLVVDSNKRLGWKELVSHQIFKKSGDGLANQFRLTLELRMPTKVDEYE